MLRGGVIHYPLPIKNYDDLRAVTRTPRILIVLLMPGDAGDWLNQTERELCLRHCGYWLSLAGYPAAQNASSVTVRIPAANMFDRGQLDDLMTKSEAGSPL